jgi:hypothetical protein
MKKASLILLFIMLALVSSITGLGVNVFGVSICEKSEIATMQSIMVNSESLVVAVKPTNSVRANLTYQVDLYERGSRRASETVVWNQIEANTRQAQNVSFSISSQEAEAYIMLTQSELRKTFSIKVHE